MFSLVYTLSAYLLKTFEQKAAAPNEESDGGSLIKANLSPCHVLCAKESKSGSAFFIIHIKIVNEHIIANLVNSVKVAIRD